MHLQRKKNATVKELKSNKKNQIKPTAWIHVCPEMKIYLDSYYWKLFLN